MRTFTPREGTMVKHGVWLSGLLVAVGVANACGPGRDEYTARVTIDMRCSSSADCPRGFQCLLETEHGPPTTLCESDDPTSTCPNGFVTRVGYSQLFCLPHLGVRSSAGAASSMTATGMAEAAAAVHAGGL